MICRIGKGAFGYVYKVREKQTRAIYATKQLPNTDNNKMEVCVDFVSIMLLLVLCDRFSYKLVSMTREWYVCTTL